MANPFTQFYSLLLHQCNMLQDNVRTSAYQNAVSLNEIDFKDKVVLDVGTGTGILAFFAVAAGAKRVYAVEASDSIESARTLATANGMQEKVRFIKGKVEDITLPEKVDVIISEPIGFLLVHERMLESYVRARDLFLKDEGMMYPSSGAMFLAPYSDEALYQEQLAKVAFWQNNNFYGLDLSSLLDRASREYFSQAVVGNISSACLLSGQRVLHNIAFEDVSCEELQDFKVNFSFQINRTAIMHGLAGWFDISFEGSSTTCVLSTSPDAPCTHWYQCRLMLRDPVAVNRGQSVSGQLHFRVNDKFSYFIDMTVCVDGTNVRSTNTVALHDQMYHHLNVS